MLSNFFIAENDTFKWPTKLQELDLRFNRLSNEFLSCLCGLPHLQFLDLNNNQLQGALDISCQYFYPLLYSNILELI